MPSLIASLMHITFSWLQEWTFMRWCMNPPFGLWPWNCLPVILKPDLSHKFSCPSSREGHFVLSGVWHVFQSMTQWEDNWSYSKSWSYCFLPFFLVCCPSISALLKLVNNGLGYRRKN
jgi:hypothetical protein